MTYVSRRRPRERQAEALDRIDGREHFALLMAMRTGKTKVIVDHWGRKLEAGESVDLLIIAPGGSYRMWGDAIGLDLPDAVLERVATFTWISSEAGKKSTKEKLKAFLAWEGPRALMVNVEAISSVEAVREMLLEYVHDRTVMGVIDESVVIKNPDAKCTRFVVLKLRPLLRYRYIMSGLVSPKSPLDVYAQFKFLDGAILGFDLYSTFKARYAKIRRLCKLPNRAIQGILRTALSIRSDGTSLASEAVLRSKMAVVYPTRDASAMARDQMVKVLDIAAEGMRRDQMIDAIPMLGGRIESVPVIEGFQNVDEIHRMIAPHSFRVRLEDCYDLPSSTYSLRDVELTGEQRRVYDDLRRFCTAELESGDHVTASQVITQILRLHQVLCGHVRDEEGGWHAIPERRTQALVDLLEDYDGKAIVWCSYDADVRRVSERLAKHFDCQVARFWGGNLKTREDEEARFKQEGSWPYMVATAAAGGRGRTWDVADLVVYYSSTNNLDHRMQSEERPKAVDKTVPIAYVDLVARGTVDEKIIQALRDKIDLAAVINGDNWREWVV